MYLHFRAYETVMYLSSIHKIKFTEMSNWLNKILLIFFFYLFFCWIISNVLKILDFNLNPNYVNTISTLFSFHKNQKQTNWTQRNLLHLTVYCIVLFGVFSSHGGSSYTRDGRVCGGKQRWDLGKITRQQTSHVARVPRGRPAEFLQSGWPWRWNTHTSLRVSQVKTL